MLSHRLSPFEALHLGGPPQAGCRSTPAEGPTGSVGNPRSAPRADHAHKALWTGHQEVSWPA